MNPPLELTLHAAVELLVSLSRLPTVYLDGLSEVAYDRPCLVPSGLLPYPTPDGDAHMLAWGDGLMLVSRELLKGIT